MSFKSVAKGMSEFIKEEKLLDFGMIILSVICLGLVVICIQLLFLEIFK